MKVKTLQRQPQDAGQAVGTAFEHVGQALAQRVGAGRQFAAVFIEQPANAVAARGALLLVALAQAVNRQLRLLVGGLDRDRNVAHVRTAGRFANRRSILGVVIAALAGHPIRADELTSDQSRLQPEPTQTPADMVRTAACLHGDDAARRQLGTPGDNFSRGSARAITTWSFRSTACTCIKRFDKSTPTGTTVQRWHGVYPGIA